MSCAAAPQTTKVSATVCDKCLVTMEKSLNLHVKDTNRKVFELTAIRFGRICYFKHPLGVSEHIPHG